MRAVLRGAELLRRLPVGFGAGQGLVEYGLILSLIAVVAIISLAFFGDQLAAALELIGDEIDRAST
jgi:Flp pilus assembly pilin Flp